MKGRNNPPPVIDMPQIMSYIISSRLTAWELHFTGLSGINLITGNPIYRNFCILSILSTIWAGHQARLVVISVFNLLDGRCHIRVQPVHLRIHYRTADYPQEAGITGADQYAHGICFFAAVYKCVKLIDLCRGYHDNNRTLICLQCLNFGLNIKSAICLCSSTSGQYGIFILPKLFPVNWLIVDVKKEPK